MKLTEVLQDQRYISAPPEKKEFIINDWYQNIKKDSRWDPEKDVKIREDITTLAVPTFVQDPSLIPIDSKSRPLPNAEDTFSTGASYTKEPTPNLSITGRLGDFANALRSDKLTPQQKVGYIAGQLKRPLEKMTVESGKAALRGTEQVLGMGMGATTQWIGDTLTEGKSPIEKIGLFKKSPKIKLLEYKVGKKLADWGSTAYDFWQKESMRGIEAPDPELFKGTFMQNPSWTRGVATVAQAIPSLAAATAITIATKNPMAGAAALGLMEGSGEYKAAKDAGVSFDKASLIGVGSTVGTTLLEVIPLTRFLKGGSGKIGKDMFIGAVQEGGEEVLQALWNNALAIWGYDKTRRYTDGMVEGFIGGAGSGGVLGGITSGRGMDIDRLREEAIQQGMLPEELDMMNDAIRNMVVLHANKIDAVLDKGAKGKIAVASVGDLKDAPTKEDLFGKEEKPTVTIIPEEGKPKISSVEDIETRIDTGELVEIDELRPHFAKSPQLLTKWIDLARQQIKLGRIQESEVIERIKAFQEKNKPKPTPKTIPPHLQDLIDKKGGTTITDVTPEGFGPTTTPTEGKVIKAFHGTPTQFETFDKKFIGKSEAVDSKLGIFFVSDKDIAQAYGEIEGTKGYVKEVSIDTSNFKVVDLLVKSEKSQKYYNDVIEPLAKKVDTIENKIDKTTDEDALDILEKQLDRATESLLSAQEKFMDITEEINKEGKKAKKEGHEGLIVKNAYISPTEDIHKISDVTVVFDTKSITTKPTPTEGKVDLTKQAKKFKTAEDFAKAQTILYRGTTNDFGAVEKEGEILSDIVYLSTDKKFAEEFGEVVHEYYADIDKNKLYDFDKNEGYYKNKKGKFVLDEDGEKIEIGFLDANPKIVEELVSRGYEGAIDGGGEFFVVFDKDKIKTKSQLADIWKEAQPTKPTPKPKPKPKTPTPRTIRGLVRQHGKISLESAKKEGYPTSSFKGWGAMGVLGKGGLAPSKMAQELVSTGQLLVEDNENPADVLIQAIQDNLPTIDYAEDQGAKALKPPSKLNAKSWQVNLPTEPTIKKTINKTEIIRAVEKMFKVPIRGKATVRVKAAGLYYPKKALIRLMKWGELEVMTHEVAHHIDKVMQKEFGYEWMRETTGKTGRVTHTRPISREMINELAGLDYDPVKRRTSEGFAEYIRHLTTSTGLASKRAPKFHKFFTEDFLKRHPDINSKLKKMKTMLDVWQQQGAENRVIAQTDYKGEHTKVPGWLNKFQKARDFILEKFNDEFYLIEKIEKQMGIKPGKNIRPTKDPFTMLTYAKSKSAGIARTFVLKKAIDPYGRVVGKGLSEIIAPIDNKKMKSFISYGIARHALDLAKRKVESGIDLDDAAYIVEKYKSDTWDKALTEITEWSNHLLDWLVWAGGLSKEASAKIREMNPIYLPFKRAFIDDISIVKGSKGIVNQGPVVKKIKGSGRPIINPIEAMIAQTTEMIAKAHKINIASLLADLSEKEGVGGFITRVPAPMKSTSFTAEQIRSQLGDIGIDLPHSTSGELDDILTVFTQDWKYGGKDNIVMIWKKGERKFYEIHPDLYRAISGIDMIKRGPVVAFLSKFARILRLGATGLRVSFGLARNPFRDAFTYAVFSKRKGATVFDPIKGIYKELTAKPGSPAWRFKAAGGALSGQLGFDRASTMAAYDELLLNNLKKFGKTLKVVKHPFDAIRDILSITELGPRTSELENQYKEYRKKHPEWSEEDAFVEAFNDAQDVTVNFTKGGSWAKKINEVAAFFNVAIRGPEKLYRSLQERPFQTIVKGVAYITLLSVGNWWKNKDKQWYKNLPPAYKYNNFWFQINDKTIIRLPIPFDLGILFGAVPMAALDYLDTKDPQYIKALVDMVKMQIPDPTPSMFGPLIDVETNKNFLGIPIESAGMQYLPTTERKKPYTMGLSISLSKALNKMGIKYSPIQLEYLFNSHTGGFIKQIPMREVKEPADIVILGELLLRMPEAPKRQLNQFHGDYERLSQRKQADLLTRAEWDQYIKIKPLYSLLTKKYYKDLASYRKQNRTDKIKETYTNMTKELTRFGYK